MFDRPKPTVGCSANGRRRMETRDSKNAVASPQNHSVTFTQQTALTARVKFLANTHGGHTVFL